MAVEALKAIPRSDKESEKQKVSAMTLLLLAWAKLERGNRKGKSLYDLPTRSLFERRLDLEIAVNLEGVFQDEFPELRMLSGLIQKPFPKIETILAEHDVLCPLALRMFCLAYQEHRAELERSVATTRPATLSCSV